MSLISALDSCNNIERKSLPLKNLNPTVLLTLSVGKILYRLKKNVPPAALQFPIFKCTAGCCSNIHDSSYWRIHLRIDCLQKSRVLFVKCTYSLNKRINDPFHCLQHSWPQTENPQLFTATPPQSCLMSSLCFLRVLWKDKRVSPTGGADCEVTESLISNSLVLNLVLNRLLCSS